MEAQTTTTNQPLDLVEANCCRVALLERKAGRESARHYGKDDCVQERSIFQIKGAVDENVCIKVLWLCHVFFVLLSGFLVGAGVLIMDRGSILLFLQGLQHRRAH